MGPFGWLECTGDGGFRPLRLFPFIKKIFLDSPHWRGLCFQGWSKNTHDRLWSSIALARRYGFAEAPYAGDRRVLWRPSGYSSVGKSDSPSKLLARVQFPLSTSSKLS